MLQLPTELEWIPFVAGAYLLVRSVRAMLDPTAQLWPPKNRNGPVYAKFIWPFRILFWGLIVVSLLVIPEVAPSPGMPGFWIGIVLLILGFGIAVHATLQLGWSVAFGQDGALQEGGWFRFSRNPVYVATWMGLAGWAILLPKAPIMAALAVWAGFYIFAVFLEERALERSHGAEFAAYKLRTARFLGWPRVDERQGS
ncbi:DUF1295 domain-containing protein [Rhodobacter sp. NTK016B]|uniref:methyltransferase family protein n=1 Tax=Rhodobacter sp. NTK016B TaxID=2759676 RepID=UPI001A8D78DB|nr:methyltransferase [Rhodobacter sp. NTK016B]MBN8291910.1 DUF1295 domain-containing protein [Rhodobacter sp. NTK016B]